MAYESWIDPRLVGFVPSKASVMPGEIRAMAGFQAERDGQYVSKFTSLSSYLLFAGTGLRVAGFRIVVPQGAHL
jgi:hypothetical protein